MENAIAQIRNGILQGLGITLVIGSLSLVPAVLAESLHVFSAGETVSSSQINSNFQKMVPMGTIVAWHKSLSGVPSLPEGWVECNGGTISDSESSMDGQAIPNLNNPPADPAGGAAGTYSAGVFLRGNTTSGGSIQDDSLQGHRHGVTTNAFTLTNPGSPSLTGGAWAFPPATITILDPTSDGTNGTPRTAKETRPVNYSVVWIMRIK